MRLNPVPVTRRTAVRSVALAALGAAVVGVAVPAQATPVPPVADPALSGVWVNTNPATGGVRQVLVTPVRAGNVTVDAFGACVPTLCEWGRVPAKIYGPSVSATSGRTFQTTQRFLTSGVEWSRTTLLGSVTVLPTGAPVLTLRQLTVFEDNSGRHNYEATDTFVHGQQLQAATKSGVSVSAYTRGAPPALDPGAFGTWKPTSATGNLASLIVSGTPAAPVIKAFGQCSPTPCTIGSARGIAFGPSVSAATGETALADYKLGFKHEQLVLTYGRNSDGVEQLTVGEYSEFTDGSGRANYTVTETLVRA